MWLYQPMQISSVQNSGAFSRHKLQEGAATSLALPTTVFNGTDYTDNWFVYVRSSPYPVN